MSIKKHNALRRIQMNQADQPYFHKKPSRLLAAWSVILVAATGLIVFRLLYLGLLDLDFLVNLL
jgi:hypothetical protein